MKRPDLGRARPRALPLVLATGMLAAAGLVAVGLVAAAEPTPAKPTEEEGARHFVEAAKVLQSPRCRNCHPSGAAPLHGDVPVAHAMNVSRRSPTAGLKCTTCHRATNADFEHGPPGVPNWRMPPDETPMVFEGLSVSELCSRLKDVTRNGNRTPDDLVEHVGHDSLILWAWSPGPGRTTPPMAHATFVDHLRAWAAAGAPCPR